MLRYVISAVLAAVTALTLAALLNDPGWRLRHGARFIDTVSAAVATTDVIAVPALGGWCLMVNRRWIRHDLGHRQA